LLKELEIPNPTKKEELKVTIWGKGSSCTPGGITLDPVEWVKERWEFELLFKHELTHYLCGKYIGFPPVRF
jgi:hypothetical protein